MEFHLKLDKFHRKYGRLDKAGFQASFNCPIVTFDVEAGAAVIRDFDSYAKTSTSSEPTSHGTEATDEFHRLLVAPVVKSDRNKIENRIIVGRSPVCDIVIPNSSVSKLHLFFEKNAGSGDLLVFDADSKFGTSVGDDVIEKGVGFPVASGDLITLAGYMKMSFYSSGDFYDFMTYAAKIAGGKSKS